MEEKVYGYDESFNKVEIVSKKTLENREEILNDYIYVDGSTISTSKNWNDLEPNKTYLTSGTYKKSLNAPIDGNLAGVLICMNMTNGAVQLYLPRLETQKIYLRGKYSNQWRDWICSADGGNASTLDGVDISDIVQKSLSGLLTFPVKNNNGLNIGLTNGIGNGKIELINNYSSAGDASNLPISQMIAIKQTFIASSTMGMVRLYELWPVRGRVWQNEYNSGASPKWNGWKLVCGKYVLWSGTATTGNSVTLSLGKSFFNGYEVFFTTGERIYCPLVDGNEDIWGSLITMAGSEFYFKSFHAQMITSTKFSILLSQEKNTGNGIVSNTNIVKIVGV